MIEYATRVRVRYAETDQMGFVYYGRYLEWFEVGRNELLRSIDMPYRRLEQDGYWLPVIEAHCEYKKPARYDDEVTIVSRLAELPRLKIRIDYQILHENQMLAEGYTLHIFTNNKGQVARPPKYFIEHLKRYYTTENRES
ncbi:MAG: thioesterase family protein [candidate division KSB1 bacterium]|nr:thioesterase family protein [candidate division KSB1 bacterium]MDQ7063150.1 thioesterase family protein [candidate division KSB1 bacterium]